MDRIINAADINIDNLPIYDDGSLKPKAKLKSITIRVKDINKSIKFYSQYLRAKLYDIQYLQSKDKATRYLVADIIPDEDVDFKIILKQRIEGFSTFQQEDKFPIKISLAINNMENYENVSAEFQQGEFVISEYDNDGEVTSLERYTDIIDPDGNLIQLIPASRETYMITPIYVKEKFDVI